MADLTAVPAEIAGMAPSFAKMGASAGREAGALDGIAQTAEQAVSNAALADALYAFRQRWGIAVNKLGEAFSATSKGLESAAQTYGVAESTNATSVSGPP